MLDQAVTAQIFENVPRDAPANNRVSLMPDPSDSNNSIRWLFEGGDLHAQILVEGRLNEVASVPADNIPWVRINEYQGSVFFEYYDSSSSRWTQAGASVATSQVFPLHSVYVVLGAQNWPGSSEQLSGEARFANLNMGYPAHP